MYKFVTVFWLLSEPKVAFLSSLIGVEDANYRALVDDLSSTCTGDYISDLFTPFGAGIVDGRMVMVSSASLYSNCSLRIQGPNSTETTTYKVIVVMELENHFKQSSPCRTKAINIQVAYRKLENEANRTNLCPKFERRKQMYWYVDIYPSSFTEIYLQFYNFSGILKLTISTGRYLGDHGLCRKSTEIVCLIKNQIICIDHRLACDGRMNCGMENMFDEAPKICEPYVFRRLLIMTSYGLLLVLMLVSVITALLKMCVPSVADDFFIFNEDEDNKLLLTTQSRPPKDANVSYLNAIGKKYDYDSKI